MATKSAIGIMRNAIMDRFAALPGFEMPTQGRDPDLLHVQQLEAVMTWIECNMDHVKPQVGNGLTMMRSLEVGPVDTLTYEWDASGVVSEGEPLAVEENELELVAMPEPPKPAPKGRGKRK